MSTRQVGIGEFRQNAAHFIKLVEETAQPIVITRRDRPVAELRPVGLVTGLRGSVSFVPGIDLTDPVIDLQDWEGSP